MCTNSDLAIKQDSAWPVSYESRKQSLLWNYDSFNEKVLSSKVKTMKFLLDRKVMGHESLSCPKCESIMVVKKCLQRHYGEEISYQCTKQHFDPIAMSK
jgi:hypothetical protein